MPIDRVAFDEGVSERLSQHSPDVPIGTATLLRVIREKLLLEQFQGARQPDPLLYPDTWQKHASLGQWGTMVWLWDMDRTTAHVRSALIVAED